MSGQEDWKAKIDGMGERRVWNRESCGVSRRLALGWEGPHQVLEDRWGRWRSARLPILEEYRAFGSAMAHALEVKMNARDELTREEKLERICEQNPAKSIPM